MAGTGACHGVSGRAGRFADTSLACEESEASHGSYVCSSPSKVASTPVTL
jgi:hypothetical protein